MAKMPTFTLQASSLSISTEWDPVTSSDEKEVASHQCLLRIKRDLMSIYNEPPPGLFVVPDEDDMTIIHALITGSFDTPYEGGFFYFLIRCPSDYPIRPPRVKLMTTGGGTVRFNPNMYKCGKICLSILGGGYEEYHLLGYDADLLARWFAGLFFDPEDGGAMFLRNVGCYTMDYTASYPRR